MMSSGKEVVKALAVVALFALMLFYGYFLTLHIDIDDVRNAAPGFIRDEIDRAIARLPPDQRSGLELPLPEIKHYGDEYLGTAGVFPGELDAMPWIRDHTNRSDKFVADIFGGEMIMGMTTRLTTVGGDWANAPDPAQMMSETDEIYKTADPARASQLAKALNATLVYLPHRELNAGWWLPYDEVNVSKFADGRYFNEVYNASGVVIYRVL